MTEKEKMMAGELYQADDPEIDKDHFYYYDLCHELNHCRPSDWEKQQEVIDKIFGKHGEHIGIFGPLEIDLGYNVEVGDHFFANHGTVMLATNKITFGDNCMVAPHCTFSCAGHPFDVERRNAAKEYAYPITVGNNVWIGMGSQICPGATIGDNTIIAAGSVVTGTIPGGVIAGGNPCKVIRKLTEEDFDRYTECEYDFDKHELIKKKR